ncbi:MAG TPA: porin [Rhodoblastus sp.]|nr:porin [Rhodoblastus sp.]
MTKRSVLSLIVGLGILGVTPACADDLTSLDQEIRSLEAQNATLARRIDRFEAIGGAPSLFVAEAASAPTALLVGDGPLTWRGITLFGVLDAGIAWQSHGAPMNAFYPQGLEYGVSKNSNRAGFALGPGGLGYSGIGLKGSEEILPGVAAIFAANTNFNPLTGQLSNGPASLVQNNGVPLASQSANGDSRSAGQAFNDYAYLGLSSPVYGELTFGRQRTLTTDDRAAYDPLAGSLAFSLLGYSSSLSSGDSENSRFDEALKYRVNLGPAHIGAIYKFAKPDAGASESNGATYQLSAGFEVSNLSFNAVYSHVSGAVSLSSLSASQLAIYPAGSLAASISDNQAVLLSAKYSYDRFKFFVGYEYYVFSDPSDPILAPFVNYNGYAVSVATNNAYQYHDKVQQLVWAGLRYAFDSRLDLSAGYYHLWQNSYGKVVCNTRSASTCSGTEDAVGVIAQYHFTKRFQLYGGLMVSTVTGGMASGFLYPNSVDPMIGLRYSF